jgi:hypothetical protein
MIDHPSDEHHPLDCAECGNQTHEMHLHARCHMDSPLWVVSLDSGTEFRIECAECRKPVATFGVKYIKGSSGKIIAGSE